MMTALLARLSDGPIRVKADPQIAVNPWTEAMRSRWDLFEKTLWPLVSTQHTIVALKRPIAQVADNGC